MLLLKIKDYWVRLVGNVLPGWEVEVLRGRGWRLRRLGRLGGLRYLWLPERALEIRGGQPPGFARIDRSGGLSYGDGKRPSVLRPVWSCAVLKRKDYWVRLAGSALPAIGRRAR
jgi:hypothetical protein